MSWTVFKEFPASRPSFKERELEWPGLWTVLDFSVETTVCGFSGGFSPWSALGGNGEGSCREKKERIFG